MEETRPRWSSRMKIVVSLLLLALGIYLLYRFSIVLKPFIVAVILAYVLSPLATKIQAGLHLRRIFATGIAYLMLIVVVGVIPLVILPPLAIQANNLNLDIQRLLHQAESLLGNEYIVAGQTIYVADAVEHLTGSLQGIAEPFVTQSLNLVLELASSVVWIIFVLVVSFYLIKDGQALRLWFEGLVPPAYRSDFIRLRTEINAIWGAFFRGQLVLALVVAALFTLVGLLLGLPFALTLGVVAGLLEFLPSIGHGIWLSIAALVALFGGSTWMDVPNWVFMLILVSLHLFFQQFDLNYLIPRVIGRSVHLPPLVVILGIVSGAVLAGVLGILLAAPTIASARVLGRYVYANLFDQEPFSAPVAPPLPPPNPHWWRKTSTQESR